jgi:hypothetical protein
MCSAFDLATESDDRAGLGSDGCAAVASEPSSASILQWWPEFSRHVLQTGAVFLLESTFMRLLLKSPICKG